MANQSKLGAGRLLVAVYAVFALSASARAVYQLATKFADAPVAYSLSAFSAAVYIVATIALATSSAKAQKVAKLTIWFELIGVLTIGSLSLIVPDWFKHPTVWSEFGIGYGGIPLLLPILGLIWLKKRAS